MGAVWGSSPTPLERRGTVVSQPGPYFLEEIGERTPRGRRFLPLGTPFSGGGTGEGGWVGMGLACGLQDQRLMARPPARAGGRSGLLTGGESGKPNGSSLPSPKGYRPTFPARPAGGRAVTGLSLGGPQARYPVRGTASPHTTPPEKGVQREEPLPSGGRSPISSQEMGPRLGNHRSPPFQRRRGRTPHRPPPRACPPTAQFAIFEKGSHLCQRKICPFLRCFFNTAPPPPWPLS